MNAIILAAGLGTRLLPATLLTPKPLITVGGTKIIERQIQYLKNVNIHDIVIVVGYHFEQFQFLEKKYGVKCLLNSEFRRYSNVFSLYIAREHLKNSYVLEGDVFLNSNFLNSKIIDSCLFIGSKKYVQGDSEIEIDRNENICRVSPSEILPTPTLNTSGCYLAAGVSYWNEAASNIIVGHLEKINHGSFSEKSKILGYRSWDYIIFNNLEHFNVKGRVIDDDAWFEIDSEHDLKYAESRILKNE